MESLFHQNETISNLHDTIPIKDALDFSVSLPQHDFALQERKRSANKTY